MRAAGALATLLVVTAACKDSPPTPTGTQTGSATVAPAADAAPDWVTTCEAALKAVPTLAPGRRVMALLQGCQPCGSFDPILGWQTMTVDGGPTLESIEQVMDSCKAFCSNAGRQAFYGALDEARGKSTERPWRRLGEVCGADVSTVPEARFASAPYFALDRVARAVAKEPRLAPLLAAVDLPLPPWAVSGSGIDVAPSPVIKPLTARYVVTVTQTELYVGTLAHATLDATGVHVDLGTAPYPGAVAKPDEVEGKLNALTGDVVDDKTETNFETPILVLAPSGVRAQRIVDAVMAISGWRTLYLGVAAPGAPPGWDLLGQSSLKLARRAHQASAWLEVNGHGDDVLAQVAKQKADDFAAYPALSLADDVTAADLAKLVGALGYHDLGAVAIARRGTEQDRTQKVTRDKSR